MGAKNRLTHCTAAQKVGRGGQLRVDRVHSHMRTFSKASTNESKKVSYVLCTKPSIYNILRWVAWTMGQTNPRPRV